MTVTQVTGKGLSRLEHCTQRKKDKYEILLKSSELSLFRPNHFSNSEFLHPVIEQIKGLDRKVLGQTKQ